MRITITGNLGYVGTVMTPLLKAEGHEVWGYDTGFYGDCILGELGETGVDRQQLKDIRDAEPEDFPGVEAVVHLAGLSNDATGELNPGLTEEINLAASIRLAEAARKAGVTRFLFASSCSVYDQSADGVLTEEAPFNPLTAHARSKVEAEAALAAMAGPHFSPVFLRNAIAYGFSPRLRFDVEVNSLTGSAVTTGQVKLMSDGRAWRPLIHVEDMSRAFVCALAVPRERLHNQALNVGREEDNHQIRSVVEAVARVVPDCRVTFAKGASANSRKYDVSYARIRERLPEFQPRWDVERGIRQLYDAFTRHGLSYEQFAGKEFARLEQLQYLMDSERVDPELKWTKMAA